MDWRQKAVQLRRRIHQNPELGLQEHDTARLVFQTLRAAHISARKISKTGVVGVVRGAKPGPCVALRADLDALPLQEKNNLPFRSRRAGVMHACGHDAHTAIVLTSALRLAREKGSLPGAVKFLFQPDEEGAAGAKQLVQDGVLSAPPVGAVFGCHVNPRFRVGTLAVKSGPLMAAVDKFTIEIRGDGGHGAYPHEGSDAVVMASTVVNALQTVVSRRVDPVEPAVLTVGTIQGGHRFNILAESVTLTGTVRTLSKTLQKRMPRLIEDIVSGIVRSMGGSYRFQYENLGDALNNDRALVDLCLRTARDVVGHRNVKVLDRPSMGGEDFSEYLKRAPGCYMYLGSSDASARSRKPWHHPGFFLNEGVLPVGVEYMTAVAKAGLAFLKTAGRR
ncbi:MAG TPA: M20 family metallopeptidase [Elusimicrobiota bacterium]|nr:M20 family metallopeptidase [Elusimicrobiota bacterium]